MSQALRSVELNSLLVTMPRLGLSAADPPLATSVPVLLTSGVCPYLFASTDHTVVAMLSSEMGPH